MRGTGDRSVAYEKGYLAIGDSLSRRNASRESAEHTLELRLKFMADTAYNCGGNDATRDYIIRLRQEELGA